MTPAEHECIQAQFVLQVGERIGVPLESVSDPEGVLLEIRRRDPRAYERLEAFRDAYQTYFKALQGLRQAAERAHGVDEAREAAIATIDPRDRTRRALENYLDREYPVSARGRPGADFRVLAGLPS